MVLVTSAESALKQLWAWVMSTEGWDTVWCAEYNWRRLSRVLLRAFLAAYLDGYGLLYEFIDVSHDVSTS